MNGKLDQARRDLLGVAATLGLLAAAPTTTSA